MKWLLVSRQHHPTHGGIGTYVQRFLSAAHDAGWNVELMTQPGYRWPRCRRVHEVHTPDMHNSFAARIPGLRRRQVVRPFRYALWSKAVAERLLTLPGDFDVIEFVDCQAEGFASIGSSQVRAQHRNAKFIVHAHTPMSIEETINGCDAHAFNREMYHAWEQRALRAADAVVVTSDVLRRALTGHCEATTIPYPIADELRSPPHRIERAERIVLVGSVQPRKGVDLWAHSLNKVLRRRPRATAVLIGPDTPTAPDGLSMAAHIQRLIDPRVIDRFQWTGSLQHNDVRDQIASASLVVVPSRLESFSFVAAEALLAGTPVLVSQQTGIAQHVPSLDRVDAGDVEALADQQMRILSDPSAARANAVAARKELLNVCEPSHVLELRRDHALNAQTRQAGTETDAFEEVCTFISMVDAASPELAASATLDSSATS